MTYSATCCSVLRLLLLLVIFSETSCLSGAVGQRTQLTRPARSQDVVKDHEDICQMEDFHANCRGDNEVIVMTTALYGRMRLQSRCIDRNYGYIGCSNDVIGLADVLCSGRRSCNVTIPNGEFEAAAAATCPRDFKMYLEATYRCQTVVAVGDPPVPCQSSAVHRLTAREGHIASSTTDATGHGSALCPWLIQGRRGHRINITLWDFTAERQRGAKASPLPPSAAAAAAATTGLQTALPTCRAYAVVREQSPARSVTICSEGRRIQQVYSSSSESVEIRILPAGYDRDHRSRHFVLQYETFGCPEFDSESSSVQWHRRNGNRMEVGCANSDVTWWMECNGFEWVGQSINCSSTGDATVMRPLPQLPSATTSLVAMTVIAVVLSALIVTGGLVILTCRRRSASQAAEIDHQEVYYRQNIKSLPPTTLDHCNLSQSPQPRPSLSHLDQQRHVVQFYNASTTFNYPLLTQQQPENEYSYIADLQLQPPTPTSGSGHVMSADGWRCDPHASGFNANIRSVYGANSSRPVAVIPGLSRDDKFRLPQRSTLKGATDHYHPKSELSFEIDADLTTVTDCATIAIRGVAPPNCGTAMSNGGGTEYHQ